MYPFLNFLLIFFTIPVLILFWYTRRAAVRFRRTGFYLLLFVVGLGGLWDWLSWRTGVWRYDSAPTLGLWIGGLPAEEFAGFYVLSAALLFLGALKGLGHV